MKSKTGLIFALMAIFSLLAAPLGTLPADPVRANIQVVDSSSVSEWLFSISEPGAAPTDLAASAKHKKGGKEHKNERSRERERKSVQPEIVGGTKTVPGEIPYQVAITNKNYGDSPFAEQFCGGSLIDADLVLTAGHCMAGTKKPENLRVIVGRTNLNAREQGVVRRVARIIKNPDFRLEKVKGDWALLLLDSPVDTALYPPIRLAGPGEEYLETPGNMAIVSGWGSLNQFIPGKKSNKRLKYPKDLYKVEVPIVSDADMLAAYPKKKGHTQFFPELEVGAGEVGKDSCWGDSGGPLAVKTDGGFVLIGIVSRGAGCGAPGRPGIYSSVIGVRPGLDAMIAEAHAAA